MMNSTRNWCTLTIIFGMTILLVSLVESAPMPSYNNGYWNREISGVEDPQPQDELMELIARFGQTIMRARDDLENSKRTVDFGLARGFSGIQEAKHRMGLAAANFAGGPGRKRRSETSE